MGVTLFSGRETGFDRGLQSRTPEDRLVWLLPWKAKPLCHDLPTCGQIGSESSACRPGAPFFHAAQPALKPNGNSFFHKKPKNKDKIS